MSGINRETVVASVIIFFISVACFASAQDAGAHYLRADVTNNLKDSSKCPGPGLWTDKLQWAIKSGECNSGGAFTPVACLNDQTKKINPGETIGAKCELNELPAGNYEIYCIRVIWCQKEPKVRGLFKLNSGENKPPVASLKVGFELYDTSKEATVLSGGGQMGFWADESKDPDGSISIYRWDFGDGQKEETSVPEAHHGYTSSGTYTASLVVVDDKGMASAPDTAKITVDNPAKAVAFAGTNQNDITHKLIEINSGATIYFDSSKSFSEKGIKKYYWFFIKDNQEAELAKDINDPGASKLEKSMDEKPSRVYTCTDEEICFYMAYLLIDDGTGLETIKGRLDYVVIMVRKDPAASSVKTVILMGKRADDITHNRLTVYPNEEVYFAPKTTGAGKIDSWTWEFSEGKKTVDVIYNYNDDPINMSFSRPGTYKLELREYIKGIYTPEYVAQAEVTVIPLPGNNPPVASIKASYDAEGKKPIDIDSSKTIHIVNTPGQVIYFSAKDSTDPDGTVTNYVWYADNIQFEKTDVAPGLTYISYGELGEHTIKVEVTDYQGGVGTEIIKVVVRSASESGGGLNIFFYPGLWTDKIESFDSLVSNISGAMQKLISPNCPEKISITNVRTQCSGMRLDDENYVTDLLQCSSKLGKNVDIFIVVTQQLMVGQQGYGESTTAGPRIIMTYGTEASPVLILTHEVGHKLGLGDEYWDECRCGKTVPNCLDPNMGGSDYVGHYEGFCAGGTQMCIYTGECKGNLNAHGGRCIMGAVADISYKPREFCPHCLEYLKSLPELQCST